MGAAVDAVWGSTCVVDAVWDPPARDRARVPARSPRQRGGRAARGASLMPQCRSLGRSQCRAAPRGRESAVCAQRISWPSSSPSTSSLPSVAAVKRSKPLPPAPPPLPRRSRPFFCFRFHFRCSCCARAASSRAAAKRPQPVDSRVRRARRWGVNRDAQPADASPPRVAHR